MSEGAEGGDRAALAAAQETIARQQEQIGRQREEIEDLRRRLEDERFGRDLRRAFSLAGLSGIVVPVISHGRLLELIVETAAQVIDAKSGSFLLLDEAARELVVEHPLGPAAREVDKLRVPLGHGIAGLVAVSGQPMAVSNARSDPRQASDIAERVGYWPESIICVPLVYADRVIGVLELLDKRGAPSFSAADLQVLGLFARQAAVAVELSRTYGSLRALIGSVLATLGGTEDEQRELQQRARVFAAAMEASPAYRRAVDIARLSHEIAEYGEEELDVCRSVLRSIARYLRSRPATASELLGLS